MRAAAPNPDRGCHFMNTKHVLRRAGKWDDWRGHMKISGRARLCTPTPAHFRELAPLTLGGYSHRVLALPNPEARKAEGESVRSLFAENKSECAKRLREIVFAA